MIRQGEAGNFRYIFRIISIESYDDGTGETVYFGGQDTTYSKWRQQWGNALPAERPLPIVIRRLAPETAGTDAEDWNTLVADYEDFGEYAHATVYASGGGNVWDLCSYNGRLYLILAYDGGWALFRGEKGGDDPNSFGWTWTEIVGRNGKYPLAMDENVETLNEQYKADYGCSEYPCALENPSTSGLLESAATPFVFQGKMYIGSFDNATSIQTQTVTKALSKLNCMLQLQKSPKLSQIFGPIYEVMAHPQRMWVMDENENIIDPSVLNILCQGILAGEDPYAFVLLSEVLVCIRQDHADNRITILPIEPDLSHHRIEGSRIRHDQKQFIEHTALKDMPDQELPYFMECKYGDKAEYRKKLDQAAGLEKITSRDIVKEDQQDDKNTDFLKTDKKLF